MEIISLKYAVLVVASVFLYYLLNPKYRIGYLAILSSAFIASFHFYLLAYVIAFSLINYFIGIKIPVSRFKIILFRAGIIFNLSQLIVLKYASFAIDPIAQIINNDFHLSKLSEIIIPIGISYFTLQGIGYLMNIKMGWEKPEKKFLNFLLYISFYPKFLSGPIERSNHFLPQLQSIKSFDEKQVADGLRIALFGFFKKIAIANQLAPYITDTYSNLNAVDGLSLWITIIIQPLYLYFDFSGYTDIAIGFSKTFGIDLIPNFNRPFFSENMTNFWKKFHISLSSWFNDYVFKQASFKRRKWGVYASVYALIITWSLFGIWHGAGWNFMLLGLVQALAIIYEFFTKKWRVILFSKLSDYPRIWFGRISTYLFYGTSLVFFFSPDINSTLSFYSKIFKNSASLQSVMSRAMREIPLSALVLIIVFLLIEFINIDYNLSFSKLEHFWSGEKKISRYFRWIIYCFVLSILFVLGSQVQKFIYAQF